MYNWDSLTRTTIEDDLYKERRKSSLPGIHMNLVVAPRLVINEIQISDEETTAGAKKLLSSKFVHE
jgi:hypothetical protein